MGDLLPANATPIERAIVQTGAERVEALNTDLLRDLHAPAACPSNILPWVAWSVNAAWPKTATEAERRSHIRTSLRRHRAYGTLAGLRMAAESTGVSIVKAITPPAKMFSGPSLTVAERNAYLERYPELRIYRYRTSGHAGHVSFAVGNAQRFLVASDAVLRFTERATLVRDGVESELASLTRTVSDAEHVATTITEVRRSGTAGHQAFVAGLPRWPATTTAAERITTVRMTSTYRAGEEPLRVATVSPGLEPIDARPLDVALRGSIDSLIPGRAFIGARSAHNAARGCLIKSSAPWRMYRSMRLFDPAIPAMRRGAILHVNQGILGMPPHHAELSIRITGTMDTRRWAGPYVRGALVSRDHKVLADGVHAMREAARVSDRIALRTKNRDIVTAGEHILSGTLSAGAIIATR